MYTERIKVYKSLSDIPNETFGLLPGTGPVYYNNNGHISESVRVFVTCREATQWVELQEGFKNFYLVPQQ